MDGIRYLDSLAPWRGQANLSLDTIAQLMAVLGNPQDQVNSIHVAGTNGKGSVSSAVAAILGAAGNRVGLYVSPHLIKPNERIVVDGLPISDALMNQYGLIVREAAHSAKLAPSYFEAITAVAFLVFAQEQLDWMVVETGLGGRLDATNIISKPRLSAIVTIDKDHEHILGAGVLNIAREKAGIVKPGSPLVCGLIEDGPFNEIANIAEGVNCPKIYRFGRDFSASLAKGRVSFSDKIGSSFEIEPALLGQHQVINMAVAIQICLLAEKSVKACQNGVKNVFWPGRLEDGKIGSRRLIVDCAHNPAGAETLVAYLKANNLFQCSIGFGAIETKNWRNMVDILEPYVKDWHILSPNAPNPVTPEAISDYLSRIGVIPKLWGSDYQGFTNFIGHNSQGPLLVTGSIYLIGALRKYLGLSEKPIWVRA